MLLTDGLYILIPVTNSIGNMLLKLSLSHRTEGRQQSFLLRQLSGYAMFVMVIVQSYLFLLDHSASVFVIILALNYLATIYSSRWFLKEHFTRREIISDAGMVAGIILFALGSHWPSVQRAWGG